VSGTIRYGEFQAARGARLEGDMRTIGSEAAPAPARADVETQGDTPEVSPDADKRGLGSMLRRK